MKKIVAINDFCIEDIAKSSAPADLQFILEHCHSVADQLTIAIKHWDVRLAVSFQNPLDKNKNPRGIIGHFQIEQELSTGLIPNPPRTRG